MFLKGAVRLKKGPTKFTRQGSPWVYSNELARIDKSLAPGSWVALEDGGGQALGYGYFNPHSLIAFRVFERAPFRSEEQARALFFKRLDHAWKLRTRAYGEQMAAGTMGRHSFRLTFGESDGVPALIIDLYEAGPGGLAVLQCHAAGADQFIPWAQQWLAQRMGVECGVVRNDVEVRRREQVELYTTTWGTLPSAPFVLEGGVRFFVNPEKGQKTGYFYDHRDNRLEFSRRAAALEGQALDAFSYVGSWGLQLIKRNPRLRLSAMDVSKSALEALSRNAEENGLKDRVELVEADFFRDKNVLKGKRFEVVVSDPPALTSSAKQAAEGRRAHEACFEGAVSWLAPGGVAALASCSFHLTWDDFLGCVARAGTAQGKQLQITFVGSQGADHPILATLPETRYLKCAFVEAMEP